MAVACILLITCVQVPVFVDEGNAAFTVTVDVSGSNFSIPFLVVRLIIILGD